MAVERHAAVDHAEGSQGPHDKSAAEGCCVVTVAGAGRAALSNNPPGSRLDKEVSGHAEKDGNDKKKG